MRRVFIALAICFRIWCCSGTVCRQLLKLLLISCCSTKHILPIPFTSSTFGQPGVNPVWKNCRLFEKLNQMYGGRSRVKVLLVNLDSKKNMDTRILPFIRSKELKSKVLFTDVVELNQRLGEIDPAWSGAIPGYFVFR
jgi:hypothetical protein